MKGKCYTIGQLHRLIDGLPDNQPLMMIDTDGLAVPVLNIDPLTVTDAADGQQILTLEFKLSE